MISPATINAKGKFSISVRSLTGSLRITGQVKGRKAIGTFRSKFSNVGVTCDSRTIHWTALPPRLVRILPGGPYRFGQPAGCSKISGAGVGAAKGLAAGAPAEEALAGPAFALPPAKRT